jgi:hypothetical protein
MAAPINQSGVNAGQVYAATAPGFAASQQMTQQNADLQYQARSMQAANEITQGDYNAGLVALGAGKAIANQTEQYNASGVQLRGSPLMVLEQTRQLANAQIANMQGQALLQANLYYQQAQGGMNNARAQMLGQQMAFNTGQTNADISGANVQQQNRQQQAQNAWQRQQYQQQIDDEKKNAETQAGVAIGRAILGAF